MKKIHHAQKGICPVACSILSRFASHPIAEPNLPPPLDPADFVLNEGDATSKAIESLIVSDLAKVGITVNTRLLSKDEWNGNVTEGNFNLAFSESWGAPYDPQTFATSWSVKNEAHFEGLKGLAAPQDKTWLDTKIQEVMLKETEPARQEAWTEILMAMHDQATELPFSGKRIPAAINKRLTGYTPGHQQFDYPAHTLRVLNGLRKVTVSPGAQTGMFSKETGVGRLDPHSYRPNEFFANNWVYDGLVEYGPQGTIIPSLAESWSVADNVGGGQKYTFALRQGVTFHDGEAWNCAAAELNFDHVLQGHTHPWYGMPAAIKEWSCVDGKFEITTNTNYYPLLQELTFIRPLRMQSPAMFVGGATSDWKTQNSCPGDGTADSVIAVGDYADEEITCAGIDGGVANCAKTDGNWNCVPNGLNVSGTGRWIYHRTESNSDGIQSVHFKINMNHWDAPSGNYVEELVVVQYDTEAEIKAALLDGSLDAVMGSGVLTGADVADLRNNHAEKVSVSLTESIQNRNIVFNTAKSPTDDLQTRKVIIHAIDKATIIDAVMSGIDAPVDSLFPKDAPYCGADLTPKPDYDLEKAVLLNCPIPTKKDERLTDDAIAAIAVVSVAALMFGVSLAVMVRRERKGKPVFQPLVPLVDKSNDKGFTSPA